MYLYNNFAVNLSYMDLEHTTLRSSDPLLGPVIGTRKVKGIELSMVVEHKFDKFFVNAKIGALYSHTDWELTVLNGNIPFSHPVYSQKKTKLLYGVGMGYSLSESVDLVLDFSESKVGDSDSTDISIFSLGAKYSF